MAKFLKKGTKLFSILKRKCPECQEGDFFEGNYFRANVRERCSECDVKFSKEPGFFQGSYYAVYGLGVAIFVTIWVAIRVLFPEAGMFVYLWTILGGLFIAAPFIYPISKIIWANLFFHYKPKLKKSENADA